MQPINMEEFVSELFKNKVILHKIDDNFIKIVDKELHWHVEKKQKVANVASCLKFLEENNVNIIIINLTNTEEIHVSLLGCLIHLLQKKHITLKLKLSNYASSLFKLLEVDHIFKNNIHH